MATTIKIQADGLARTRTGDRAIFAIGTVGDRLSKDAFDLYYSAIKTAGANLPFGSFFDRNRYVWRVDSAALAAIVAAFQRSLASCSIALDDAARAACANGVEDARAAQERAEEARTAVLWATSDAIQRVSSTLAKRGHSLFSFQREGIAHLCSVRPSHATLLADEMGLGKTLQTIAALRSRAVVIAPAVAKGVWAREIKAYRPDLSVVVLSGRQSFRWPAEGEVVITNYDVLPAAPKGKTDKGLPVLYTETSVGEAPQGCDLVLDEAHALKSNKAQRTNNVRSLRCSVSRQQGRTFVLTATPMLNRPSELWSILTTAGLHRAAFGSYDHFARLFGARTNSWGGTEWNGPTSEGQREIGSRLERVMLRRLRANVTDLPRKTHQIVPVELSASCARAADKFLAELTKSGKTIEDVLEGRVAAAFEKISAIRATLASAKVDAMIEEVESYEDAGEPVVVFSAHRAPIDTLSAREGWRVITGDTSAEERAAIQDAFQRGELRGVGATIKAGGVAITLTRANHAIFVDLEWTPALNAQAEDRILRIGQTRSVTIKRLVATHPLDERIAELLSEKQSMINASIEQTSGKVAAPVAATVEIPDIDLDACLSSLDAERREREVNVAREREAKARKHNAKRSHYAGNASEGEPRVARTAREQWAHYGVLSLDESCDGVREQDQQGWSVATRGAGHWLAVELQATDGQLTEKGWRTAIAVCARHQGQIGSMPQE